MSSETSHIAQVENKFATYRIVDGLLHLDFKPNVDLDIYDARKVVADRLRLQEGRDYYVLCDTSGIRDTTKPARDYFARMSSEQVKGIAFVTTPKVGYTMLRLYLQHHPTSVKTRIFANRDLAIKYLSSYL